MWPVEMQVQRAEPCACLRCSGQMSVVGEVSLMPMIFATSLRPGLAQIRRAESAPETSTTAESKYRPSRRTKASSRSSLALLGALTEHRAA